MPTGSGKSLCYQLPALMRDRPDARRLPARVADAGPGRGAGAGRAGARGAGQRAAGQRDQPAGGRARGGRARAAALRRARAVRVARLPRAHPPRADRPVRGRRGALRLPVGPRLPARLLPPRRCRALARRAGDHGLDRDGHAAGGGRHRRAARAARSRARVDRLRPPEPLVRRRRLRDQGGRPPRDLRRAEGARRPARDRLRGHARGERPAVAAAVVRSWGWRRSPTTRVCRARSAPPRSGASWPARPRSWWPPTRSGWASTRPTCARSATRASRARSRPTTRRPAARAATASLRAACCSPRAGTRGCTSSSSSARRSATTSWRRSRRRSSALRARPPTLRPARRPPATTSRWPSSSRHTGEEEKVRSIVGHLARAGIVLPSPSAPDRVTGRLSGEWDGRARARCRTAAQEGTRVRWRQYRAVWGWVEGSQCRRLGILRHFGDNAVPAPLVPCCDVCDPSIVPAPATGRRPGRARAAAKAQLAQRPVAAGEAGDLDEAILETVATAPARGRPDARGGDPARRALEGGRQVLLRRAGALRRVRASAAATRCSRASTRC